MAEFTNPKIFITGIPTAGKSYLADKIVKETGGFCLETDNLRDKLAKDPRYKKWADFFDTEDEQDYYTNNDPQKQWQILAENHEKLWPGVLEEIRKYEKGKIPIKSKLAAYLRNPLSSNRPIVFEGINLLPHLTKKDLDFSGIILVGKSFEEVLERNRKNPRWGQTEKMIKMGAEAFWFVERPRYIKEAEDCGYKIFEDADEAYDEAMKILHLK